MKKRTLKRTLCIVLSIVLVTAFNSSMNVFAATTSNQYAYSIGCDHGSWAWLLGGHEGDFTGNVNYAATCYGMIGSITSSYKNYKPTYTYMRGNNPDGTRRIASKIVFLNGHANYNCLIHNHSNDDGDYATGVYIGNDYNSDTGYKYAGFNSTDMSTCDHISLVGCSTASNGNYNITWKAVDRGANSALGFTDSIHSRTSAGKTWLEKYNDGLANGYTISRCVIYATGFSSSSDLATYAKIYGSSANTVTDSKGASEFPFNTVITNISAKGIENVVEAKSEEASGMTSSIVAEIKKLDANFDLNDYRMTVNMFAPQDGNGMITFSYYMDDTVKTNKGFVAVIENNVIVEIFANDVATKEQKGELDTKGVAEVNLVTLAKNHMASKSALTIDSTKNVVKTTENYYYDYLTGKLVCEESIFYSLAESDGVIVDYTVETVIN